MNTLPKKFTNITKIISYLENIGNGYTNPNVIQLLKSFDEISIKRLKQIDDLIVSIHHVKDTIMVDYWNSYTPESIWTVEIQNCHISDDACECYHGGLALFLSHIRPDAILINNFYFGLCFDEETDTMYYDEERYLEELSGESVLEISYKIMENEA